MPEFTQEGGLFKIDTPLGTDVLLLRGFHGSEGISRLFRFQLDLLSEKSSIEFSDIIGKNVTISLKQPDDSYRYINGIISRFAQHATEEQFTAYTAEMVPWLWLLTRDADCHGFVNKGIPDIITAVFNDLGFNDFENKLQNSYPTRDYCVQYRESSFNFVSRLMEQNGIFYFFKHEEHRHTLVLADSPTSHDTCPGRSEIIYGTVAGGPHEDLITSWQLEQELRPGKYSQQDYNFKTPSANLMATEPTMYDVGGNTKFEIYDYPGEHLTQDAGQKLSKVRMQEVEAGHLVGYGTSTCRMFISGYKFTLQAHPSEAMNKEYVLTEIQHHGVTDAFRTTGGAKGESYSNSFTCIPELIPFRPARVTVRPHVHSLASAVVIGPDGDEINTDEFGRIQVMFPWDQYRYGTGTAWCRVSQIWAGKNWGAIFLPRIGQEVWVDFEEGDPDHPVIVGCVYNAQQMPPCTLPDKQNISGFRTRSTKGGGEHDSNVLTFDDTMGSEVFYMRAQKDMAVRVENNDDLKVLNDQTITITNNRTEVVQKGNEKVTIQQGNRDVTISQGNESLTISMGNDSLKISMGNQSTKLDLGASTTEAMQSITLKVGQNSIVIDQTGVTIKGTMVTIEGQAITQVKGDGMLILKGGMVMIN
jgi:type VI secretion system secreted protein VgrG